MPEKKFNKVNKQKIFLKKKYYLHLCCFIYRLRDSDAEQAESLIQIHETDKEV